jgi:3-oxoacyl-[acyl-carrier-protein] synthase-1
MVTALGCNAPMTAASVRAGLARFSESYLIDKAGEPMLLSMTDFIDGDLRGLNRLLQLAVPAVKEALSTFLQNGLPKNLLSQMPIYLGIASSRPGCDPNVEQSILFRMESEIDLLFTKKDRIVFPADHASGLMGMEKAVQLINSGKSELALVGGVDTYYDVDTLEWLDENNRLHSEANKDGFIPGEGAGFCLLSSSEFAMRYRLKPLANILSAVSGEEPNPFASDGICIGDGLTKVLHSTLSTLSEGELADWTICDMNGESFRAMEWTYAYLRTSKQHGEPLEIWHPADCYGDIGAASGPVLTGIAVAAFNKRYGRGIRPLVWTSSDQSYRSAMLLSLPIKGKS